MSIYYKIFSKIYENAAQKMCYHCKDFIEQKSKILDLGCGSGIVGKAFQKFFKAQLIGVDIKDQRLVNIPFKIIDGEKLPFNNSFFDVVLISYVLHHAKNPFPLLNEAKRVTKGKIIIFEDLPEGLLSNFICKIHGFSYDYFFQKNNEKGKFLNEKKWKKIFNQLGLKLIFEKRVSLFLNPVKKKLFVLEKI